MWLKQKLGVENADNLFTRHGFVKRKDSRRKVCVSVNGEEYWFDFETNVIYEILAKKIKFAICIQWREVHLFINKDYIYIPESDTTSPYRTYYEGLMKEPFRFCYPFDKKVVIETEEHDRLIFEIVKAGKSL